MAVCSGVPTLLLETYGRSRSRVYLLSPKSLIVHYGRKWVFLGLFINNSYCSRPAVIRQLRKSSSRRLADVWQLPKASLSTMVRNESFLAFYQKIVMQSSGSHQTVVWQSSGSCKEVIRQTFGNRQKPHCPLWSEMSLFRRFMEQ